MKKTIYDEIYVNGELYNAVGLNKKGTSDIILITKVTNEIRFNKNNTLQQKVEVRHLFENSEKGNFWDEESCDIWLDVPKVDEE